MALQLLYAEPILAAAAQIRDVSFAKTSRRKNHTMQKQRDE
jgi:hypothetical protein